MTLRKSRPPPMLVTALLLTGAAAALASCHAASRIDSRSPTVSYRYSGEGIDAAAQRAEAYCHERYDRHAQLVKQDDYDHRATFACE